MTHRTLFISSSLIAMLALAVLIHPRAPTAPTLRLYAGAGLRPAVEKLVAEFEHLKGIRVEPDYGGSGMMLARAREDPQADLFMPGDAWYVNRLQLLSSNVAAQAMVARLAPMIIVARGNPKNLHSIADLARPDVHVGLGDPHACQIGCVSTQILHRAGIAPESIHAQEALTVNELGVWVKMRNVDAAIVWDAIANSITDEVDCIEIPADLRIDSDVVLARLTQSRNPALANQFVAFVLGAEGQGILREAGYRPASSAPLATHATTPTPQPPERLEWPVMGTTAAVSTPAASAQDLPALRAPVEEAFAEINAHFSIFQPESDLSRANRAAGNGEFVTLSPDVADVLRVALRLSRDSGGVFDPTIGPLMAAWGFRGGSVRKEPVPEELADARTLVGWNHILWDATASNRIRLNLPGMRLDLGGIAKGYAVDVGYNRLLQAGFTNFMVDLGGNLRVHGEAAPGRGGWRTGIRHPFEAGEIVGTLLLTNGESVATSGNYERFVEFNGHHYAHIMDPRTGRPAEGVAGVTVLAPSGLQCDGLSATLFILGPEAGQKFLAQRPGCEACWIPDRKPLRLFATPGFACRFTPQPEFQSALTVLQ